MYANLHDDTHLKTLLGICDTVKTWIEAGIVISCKMYTIFLNAQILGRKSSPCTLGDLTCKICPTMEFDLTACQLPTIAPPMPKGGGEGSGGIH